LAIDKGEVPRILAAAQRAASFSSDDIMNKFDTPNGITPDQAAAHAFLAELRTRITTQPLPYQYGVEARALESLWEVFGHARAAIKQYPGCMKFADEVTQMLNVDLRPVTAKWHRAYSEGRLNSRDGADEFRIDLQEVQEKLRDFAGKLHQMAYGGQPLIDRSASGPMTEEELEKCFADVSFGIDKGSLIKKEIIDGINEAEAGAVTQRRSNLDVVATEGKNAVGLGLSGGGIRSATFCLGVTQVLAKRNLLKDVDFLSTVSGGGYVGCFLTTRLKLKKSHETVANPHGPDPEPIRYLRRHAKYLTAVDLWERWSMVTSTVAGMLLNWTAPLFLITSAALIAICIGQSWPDFPFARIFTASLALTTLALVLYGGLIRCRASASYKGGMFLGITSALTLFVGSCWLLTIGHETLRTWPVGFGWTTGIAAGATTVFPAIVRFLPILQKPAVRTIALKIALVVAGLVIPIGAIALFYMFFDLGKMPGSPGLSPWNPRHYSGFVILLALEFLFGLIAILLLNVNLTGPHRLYRDRLARTFIQDDENNAAPVYLKEINKDNFAPYHLINATVNLPSSTDQALRERRSDFFLFSREYCGAPSVGYEKTSEWKANGADADLATAMAVSGAAASSYMGLGSIPSLTALLTFLNVRLGFWMLRPDRNPLLKTPGFLCLIREMTGIAMSEKQDWLNLSDGGHIENMAVYELLRRRCKFIISVDGESDPQSTFQGHLTLVRHAQIDFGIRIDPKLNELRPDVKSKYSQTHAMFCRIHYPTGDTGLILYIKLSVTGNESELIKRYRLLHTDFPNQTTLDQFFDEEQFEAYRQLGVHVTEGLFSEALLRTATSPATISQWFRHLAESLLEPKKT
jgi:hypothetical protein